MLGVTVIGFVVADPGVHKNVLPAPLTVAVNCTDPPSGTLVVGDAAKVTVGKARYVNVITFEYTAEPPDASVTLRR